MRVTVKRDVNQIRHDRHTGEVFTFDQVTEKAIDARLRPDILAKEPFIHIVKSSENHTDVDSTIQMTIQCRKFSDGQLFIGDIHNKLVSKIFKS